MKKWQNYLEWIEIKVKLSYPDKVQIAFSEQ